MSNSYQLSSRTNFNYKWSLGCTSNFCNNFTDCINIFLVVFVEQLHFFPNNDVIYPIVVGTSTYLHQRIKQGGIGFRPEEILGMGIDQSLVRNSWECSSQKCLQCLITFFPSYFGTSILYRLLVLVIEDLKEWQCEFLCIRHPDIGFSPIKI